MNFSVCSAHEPAESEGDFPDELTPKRVARPVRNFHYVCIQYLIAKSLCQGFQVNGVSNWLKSKKKYVFKIYFKGLVGYWY